jgi:hypothetical protein
MNYTCHGPIVSPSEFLDVSLLSNALARPRRHCKPVPRSNFGTQDIEKACQGYADSLQTKPQEEQVPELMFEIQNKYTNCTIRRYVKANRLSSSRVLP